MLRVVCGECGKKLEIPEAWARNVVKCPQCREPIDLQERDSAECAVKLGQFFNDNLAEQAPGAGKSRPGNRPASPTAPTGPGPLDIVWRSVRAFVERHVLIVSIAGVALLLILLDAAWLHTGTVTMGAILGGLAAGAAWKSEISGHGPNAANRAEIEYKVAMVLVGLIGLRMAWFCWAETAAIVEANDLAEVAPVLELLPKWGAIAVVFLVAAVVLGIAMGSLALVQRSSIYHVLAGGLVSLSLAYGIFDVVAHEAAGVGVGQFVRQQMQAPDEQPVWDPNSLGGSPASKTPAPGAESKPEDGLAAKGVMIETSAQDPGPPPEPEVIDWTATADPPPSAGPKISSRLPDIHMGAQLWNPLTPSVPSGWLALGDNRTETSVRQLWDLARNSRVGELAGQIEFLEPLTLSAYEPVIAGFIPGNALVEVWSLAEGSLVGRLSSPSLTGSARPFIGFLAPETLLLVYSPGTDPKAPAVCQIWDYVRGEMRAEFVASGSNSDVKTKWALSPGHRYLVEVDGTFLHVYDLAEKRIAGQVNVPGLPTAGAMECMGLAFAPSGQQVTAVFRGDKKSRLMAWNMSDGKVAADREFNFDLARNAAPDARPIEALPGGAGWLAFERVLIPSFSGKVVKATTVSEASIPASQMPRFAKALDSERLLLIVNDGLQIVKLPSRKKATSKELMTLYQLVNRGTVPAVEGKPGTSGKVVAGAGQSPDGGVKDSVSRFYMRQTYIDFLTSDDERVAEMARWAPWSNRPVFGVRLGLGVMTTNVPARLLQVQMLLPITGPIGPTLVAAFDERLADGILGNLPPGEDPRLPRVAWLGVGNRGQITAAAKRQDVDVIIGMSVNWQKGDQRQIQVTIVDRINGLPIYKSSLLKLAAAGAGASGTDPAEKWLNDLMRQVDQKMTLQPMPSMTADEAKEASEKLVAAKRQDLPADLAEIRIYQARHLIDEASAASYYEHLLGDGLGETFASGDSDQRREILEEVLPSD